MDQLRDGGEIRTGFVEETRNIDILARHRRRWEGDIHYFLQE